MIGVNHATCVPGVTGDDSNSSCYLIYYGVTVGITASLQLQGPVFKPNPKLGKTFVCSHVSTAPVSKRGWVRGMYRSTCSAAIAFRL